MPLAIWAAAACAPGAPEAAPQPGAAAELTGTEWALHSLQGTPALAGLEVTLSFEDTTFGGYTGCNWMGGRYAAGADTLRFLDATTTLRACVDPAPAEQEARFTRALEEVRRFRVSGDTLVLSGADGAPLLRLLQRRLAEMDPAAVQGSWRLIGRDGRPADAAAQMTVSFGDTTLSGFGGCRRFEGAYRAAGHRLSVTSLEMRDTECPREALIGPEGAYVSGLSEATDFQVRGDTLVLHAAGGAVLVFARTGS